MYEVGEKITTVSSKDDSFVFSSNHEDWIKAKKRGSKASPETEDELTRYLRAQCKLISEGKGNPRSVKTDGKYLSAEQASEKFNIPMRVAEELIPEPIHWQEARMKSAKWKKAMEKDRAIRFKKTMKELKNKYS